MDTYFDKEKCVSRLMAEYAKHPKLIVALDFDDTIFDFHKKGHTFDSVVALVKKCQNLGFYIVIFTGTAKAEWQRIWDHCATIGITPCKINENPFPLPFGNDGKIYYNILLCDRAGLWSAYEQLAEVVYRIENPDYTYEGRSY